MDIVEPKPDSFFATAAGVCVYVQVGRRAVRVQFASSTAPAAIDGYHEPGTREAIAVATKAFEAHKRRILPLFDCIARELAERSRYHAGETAISCDQSTASWARTS